MRKMRVCLLAIAAARLLVLAPDSANAQALQAQAARNPTALSQRARQAHAESSIPSVTSMAYDYATAYYFNGGHSDPVCRPRGPVILADGLRHVCQ